VPAVYSKATERVRVRATCKMLGELDKEGLVVSALFCYYISVKTINNQKLCIMYFCITSAGIRQIELLSIENQLY